jgi:hypothetical protein
LEGWKLKTGGSKCPSTGCVLVVFAQDTRAPNAVPGRNVEMKDVPSLTTSYSMEEAVTTAIQQPMFLSSSLQPQQQIQCRILLRNLRVILFF